MIYLLLNMYEDYQAMSEFFAGRAFSISPSALVWIIVMQVLFALGCTVMITQYPRITTGRLQITSRFRVPSMALVIGTFLLSALLALALLNDNVQTSMVYLFCRLEILWEIWGV